MGFQAPTLHLVSDFLLPAPRLFFLPSHVGPVPPFPLAPTAAPALAAAEQRENKLRVLLGPLGVPLPKLPGVSVWQVTFCWHWAPGSGRVRLGEGARSLKREFSMHV